MTSKVKPVPEGFHTATPYLIIGGAARQKVKPPGLRALVPAEALPGVRM